MEMKTRAQTSLVYNPHCTSQQHGTTRSVPHLSEITNFTVSECHLGYALLAKSKPARDPTLRLRRLPLHGLIKVIDRFIELLFRVILRLFELGCGIARELFEFGLGLAHFGRYGPVGFVNFVADITNLDASL